MIDNGDISRTPDKAFRRRHRSSYTMRPSMEKSRTQKNTNKNMERRNIIFYYGKTKNK